MNVLALDLGTKTGYAYNRGDKFIAGTWTLASAKEVTAWGKVRLNRRNDPRIERLCDHISDICIWPGVGAFDAIVFEDVQFVSTTFQAHLWAGLRSAVWLCGKTEHFDCVPVATLKKFATGNGGATKQAMAQHLFRSKHLPRFEAGLPGLDDNGVDAVWLWHWAQKNLTRLAPSTTITQ